ncbi:MAG: carbohydrate ABC transporter permease [Alphaproteobacteria bacterium]
MSKKIQESNITQKVMAYALIASGALVMLLPFYFMFVFATHERADIFSMPPPTFFGVAIFENLENLFSKVPFLRNAALSLYVAIMSTALSLVFCTMGGYAFAFFEFPGKKQLFALVLGTMLLPSFLGMIPTFMIMDTLGWLDQPRALYIPGAAGAFGIFLMRQYISSAIPKEIIQSARVDGAGELRILFTIVFPLAGPALGTLGIVTFVASMNNFIAPLIVMRTPEMYTIPLALRSLQSPVDTPWGAIMAGSAIATLPLIIIFIFFSQKIISGLTTGAVK